MDSQSLDPSLKLLLDALERTPDNAPLRVHVADMLAKAGQHAQAIRHYRQAVSDASVSSEARLGLARCALAMGDAEGSIEACDALLKEVPDFARGLIARAKARHSRGQHREGLADYERATSLDSTLHEPSLRDALIRDTSDPRAKFRVVSGGDSAPSGAAANVPDTSVPDRVTFADVGGLDEVKEKIRMRIVYPFANPELFKAYGKKVGGGVLFYGPPGCGKTFMAKATAGECRANFINVGLHEVLDMWIGNSEKQLHQLFEDARRRAPSVLFFDEVDALGMQRAKLHSGSMRGVITQFLAELDGFASRNERVLVIGATNTPWDLDPAFRRPGRFDQVLFVPPPDRSAREQILSLKAHAKPTESLDFGAIAQQTEGWSGADLEHLLDSAAELALAQSIARGSLEPITMTHVDKARAKIRPTTREWFSTARNYAQYANEAGQYDDIADYIRQHNY
ncbi:MAG: AAA family ATPase [Deltaproteobacteria bacterium]|nr:AAA family ATPase [Deltaproteobacteria bacterium]